MTVTRGLYDGFWYYRFNTFEEGCWTGPFNTRDAAIAHARKLLGDRK